MIHVYIISFNIDVIKNPCSQQVSVLLCSGTSVIARAMGCVVVSSQGAMTVRARFGTQRRERSYTRWRATRMWCMPSPSTILMGEHLDWPQV